MGAACSNESVVGGTTAVSSPPPSTSTAAAAAPAFTDDGTEPSSERRTIDEEAPTVEGGEARGGGGRQGGRTGGVSSATTTTTDRPPPPSSPFPPSPPPPPPPRRRSHPHAPPFKMNPFPAMSTIPMALTITYSFRSTRSAQRSRRRLRGRKKDAEYLRSSPPPPPLPAKFKHFELLSDDVVISILSYVSYVPGEASTTESQRCLDVCRLMNSYNREATDDARRRKLLRGRCKQPKSKRRLSDHLRRRSSNGTSDDRGVSGASALALEIINGSNDEDDRDLPVPKVESPCSFGTLTHVFPLVSRRIRNLCVTSDVPWREALVRLASDAIEHEYDWEAGLRSYVDEELGTSEEGEGEGDTAEDDGFGGEGFVERERRRRRERALSFFDRGGGHRLHSSHPPRSSFREHYRPPSLRDVLYSREYPFWSHRDLRSVELERRRAVDAARLVARACKPPPPPPVERRSGDDDGARTTAAARRASDSFLERSLTTSIPMPSTSPSSPSGGNARRVYASIRSNHMRFTGPVYAATTSTAASATSLHSDVHVGHGFALHIFAPPHRTMIREIMRNRPRKEREGVPLSECPKPKFVYAYDAPPLRGGSKAVIVEVRRCVVDRRGVVDVILVPTAHVVVESVAERRNFGGMYDATVRKTSPS